MFNEVYEIDENGFIKELYLAKVDENGNILDEDMKAFINVRLPQPLYFYKPKWNIDKWVEGETEEERLEREAFELEESKKPTEEELKKADREMETLLLLEDLGVLG